MVEPALAWLCKHGLSLLASFVIARSLKIHDLIPPKNERTIGFVFRWLDQHLVAVETSFVLGPLLDGLIYPRQTRRRQLDSLFAGWTSTLLPLKLRLC